MERVRSLVNVLLTPISYAGMKGCLKASVAKAWTDSAGVWQEWSLVDGELGAWWRKIEKWEVVYKPPLAENDEMHDTAWALVAGDRISQRSAYNMEEFFADEVGREFGVPLTVVDWYWIVAHEDDGGCQRN